MTALTHARALFLGLVLSGAAALPAHANTVGFFGNTLTSLARKQAPTTYLLRASQELEQVSLVSDPAGDASAKYYIFFNSLTLPGYLSEDGATLKPLDEIGATDIGLIYHELWHVYFHRVLKVEDPRFERLFSRMARHHFPTMKVSQRLEALEEVYGAFLTNVIAHYMFLQKSFSASSAEERARKLAPYAIKSLNEVMHDAYEGTYSDFWGKTTYTRGIRLTQREIDWIQAHLFENLLRY